MTPSQVKLLAAIDLIKEVLSKVGQGVRYTAFYDSMVAINKDWETFRGVTITGSLL